MSSSLSRDFGLAAFSSFLAVVVTDEARVDCA